MADTVRELTIGRGHDPRDFVIYSYGGAGPMHCAGFAAELGVGKIVVPTTSMVQSAYGALASDIHHTAERSFLMRGGGGEAELWEGFDAEAIEDRFVELEEKCRAILDDYDIPVADTTLQRSIDARYRTQTHDLIIPMDSARIDDERVREVVALFEQTYESTYGKGSGFREAGVEISTFRVDAIGRTKKPTIAPMETRPKGDRRERPIFDWTTGDTTSATVLDWQQMSLDEEVFGPAILEHPTTTVYVGVGQKAALDSYGNLIIETSD